MSIEKEVLERLQNWSIELTIDSSQDTALIQNLCKEMIDLSEGALFLDYFDGPRSTKMQDLVEKEITNLYILRTKKFPVLLFKLQNAPFDLYNASIIPATEQNSLKASLKGLLAFNLRNLAEGTKETMDKEILCNIFEQLLYLELHLELTLSDCRQSLAEKSTSDITQELLSLKDEADKASLLILQKWFESRDKDKDNLVAKKQLLTYYIDYIRARVTSEL